MLVYDARCPDCGQPIRWARLENGQKVALDPRPSAKGRLVLEQKRGGDRAVEAKAAHGDQPRYAAHPNPCGGGR